MNKKEILIIFVLAVLTTMGTAVLEMGQRDYSDHEYGFPLDFLSIGWFFITDIDAPPFVLSVLFWFLVIFGVWRVIEIVKKKRV